LREGEGEREREREREGKNNHKFALVADKRQQRPHNRICVKNAKQAKFCFEMVTERDKEIEGQMGQRERNWKIMEWDGKHGERGGDVVNTKMKNYKREERKIRGKWNREKEKEKGKRERKERKKREKGKRKRREKKEREKEREKGKREREQRKRQRKRTGKENREREQRKGTENENREW
jgi:hypothetical protein